PEHLTRAWQRACEEVSNSNQVYIVAPRISADDESDLQRFGLTPDELNLAKNLIDEEDSASLKLAMSSVEELYPLLSGGVMRDLRVGKLHGRLSSDEKASVMQAFVRHEVAENLLSKDPTLAANPELANAVEKLRQEERAAYLEKR
ncbi:MAG: hypothetical protein EBY10_01240, partial [Actinobacteria bacterium]|nr:hypothetical protein [Actinomycetota bacterium]